MAPHRAGSATDYTTAILVDQSPAQAFEAIGQVRAWWKGDIEGSADHLGAEFTYRSEPFHVSTQQVVEFLPGRRIVWLVTGSRLTFVQKANEWTGTRITFDISKKGSQTEVRFTHVGLAPMQECYDACSDAWGSIIKTGLRDFIAAGGRPGPPSPTEKQGR
jgi:hypothetical protein